MLLRHIYEHASFVVAWLGLATDESDRVMDLVAQLWQILLRDPSLIATFSADSNQNIMDAWEIMENDPNMRSYIEGPECTETITALKSLLHRQYWRRAWVLQEIAVAKEVVIACGTKSVSLESFESFAVIFTNFLASSSHYLFSTFDFRELWVGRTLTNLTKAPMASPALQMLKERRWHQQSSDKRTLLQLLINTNVISGANMKLQAKIPKDIIYAMLGLAVDTKDLDISANYAESDEGVYIDTAGKLLSRDFGLLLISSHSNNASAKDVPSWVPDWRLDLRSSPNDCSFLERKFCASGGHQPIFPHTTNNGKILAVTGMKVDIIEHMGSVFNILAEDSNRALQVPSIQLFLSQIGNFCHLSASLHDQVYGEHWISEALYRIPVSDQEADGALSGCLRRLTIESEQQYKSLLAFINYHDGVMTGTIDGLQLSEFVKSNWVKFSPYLSMLQRGAGRRPFMTKSGYVGVGPMNLGLGDTVSIFMGSPVPFILHDEKENRYSLVGDTYVHGIMDGEFMGKNAETEVFLLV